MSDDKKKKNQSSYPIDRQFGFGPLWNVETGHKKPVSRRDFLSLAMNASIGFFMLPSLVEVATRRLLAQSTTGCDTLLAPQLPLKIFLLDCAGGIPYFLSSIFGAHGGQMDPIPQTNGYMSYGFADSLSIKDPALRALVNQEFGIALYPDTQFLQNMTSIVSPGYRKNVDGFTIAGTSQSDTTSNMLSTIYAWHRFGFNGSLTYAFGTEDGDTSGRHQAMRNSMRPEARPLRVNSPSAARSLAGYGELQRIFGTGDKGIEKAEQVLKSIRNLSERKREEFTNLALSDQMDALISCKLNAAITRPASISRDSIFPDNWTSTTSPGYDQVLHQVFGGSDERTAVAAKLLYDGTSAVAGVMIGGGDCHANQAPNAPQDKLGELGRNIAKVIEYFARKNASTGQNQSVAIICTTDGSMSASTGRPYSFTLDGQSVTLYGMPGDSDSQSMQQLFLYSPLIDNTTKNIFRDPNDGRQLGAYLSKGGADQSYLPKTSSDPSNQALALVYNILALFGRESEYTQLTDGRQIFDNPAYLRFKKIF